MVPKVLPQTSNSEEAITTSLGGARGENSVIGSQ